MNQKKIRILMFGLIVFIGCKSGSQLKNDLYFDNLNGDIKSVKTIKYNAVDNLGGITIEGENQYIEKKITKYNIKGNIVEFTNFKPDNIIQNKLVNYHNKEGFIIESKMYNSKGRLSYKTNKIKYSKGRIIESTDYDSSGELLSITKYKRDNNGNMLEVTSYNPEGNPLARIVSKYDNTGNRIEEISIINEIFQYKYILKYDSVENVIEKIEYDKNGLKIATETFSYEIDNHGNWIRRVTFEDSIPKYIIKREIEYY